MSGNVSVVTASDSQVGETTKSVAAHWLIYFYLVQFLCQVALLTSTFSSARVFFRTSSYGMSIAALVISAARPGTRRLPAAPWALAAASILALEILHPSTAGAIAALATTTMYLAIFGPIFWVPRLNVNLEWFRRTAILVWTFQSISALVGVLQVYFPGSFQPAIATVISDEYISALQITLANGEHILRPSGLTDTPGGAAVAGTYTILLAIGIWSNQVSRWFRALLAASVGIGMFTLYICEIRSLVVMVAISLFALILVHALRGRPKLVVGTGAGLALVAVLAFVAAVSIGGDDVVRRLSTLTESSPTDVYYTNRGVFLEHTLTDLLPEYPLGAGLGRWGMMASYFGGSAVSIIYVEIQWTGWLLDGGVPLVVCYCVMIGLTLMATWSLTKELRGAPRELSRWAAMLIAYDIGTAALTFNFPVFMSNFGLDFWLLNAALWAAAQQYMSTPSARTHARQS